MKIYAKYSDKNGEVCMFKDNGIYNYNAKIFEQGDVFSVVMKQFYTPGSCQYESRAYIYYDLEQAIDEYRACIDKLHNRVPARMCAANPVRRCACSPKNCPQEFGGPAFWQMFRESCMKRSR